MMMGGTASQDGNLAQLSKLNLNAVLRNTNRPLVELSDVKF